MTPNEFKAWFDGFTEAFDSRVPTKAQWARVKERVAEIDGKSVTERIYLDRYWPTYAPRYGYSHWQTLGGVGQSTTFTATCANLGANSLNATSDFKMPQSQSFNSTNAMYALGAADANALNS